MALTKQNIENEFPGGMCLIKEILKLIGEDSEREGLKDTPFRVVKSWTEIFGGYGMDPSEILSTFFEDNMQSMTDEIIICTNITFTSMCEHHMMPFSGICHVGYLPENRVIGLSKIPRLVECFARRLQIQEVLTSQIADSMVEFIQPAGVGVIVKAQHSCMCSRGVKNPTGQMVTSAMRGKFKTQNQTRSEFLQLISN